MSLPPALYQAFLATRYTAAAPFGTVVVRIGRRHPALDAQLAADGHAGWVYLGACNPHAQLLDAGTNARLHARFGRVLARLGRSGWSGYGVPAGDDWPPEPAWLVPGLEPALARRLALRYGQLAYVHGRHGEPAVLVLSGIRTR